jgi:hypothetical protein
VFTTTVPVSRAPPVGRGPVLSSEGRRAMRAWRHRR